jgi:hypothetical protein
MGSFTVTAQVSDGDLYGTVLQVVVLTGASDTQPGAEDTGPFLVGTGITRTLTPQTTGSLVYGVDSCAALPAGPYDDATTLLDGSPFGYGPSPDVGIGGHGAFFRSTGTTTEGTPVTLGVDMGQTATGFLAVAEIVADGELAEDASAPALVSSLNNDPATTAAFDPPAGSLLVAMVASARSDETNPVVSISDTRDLGLEWAELASLGPPDSGRIAGIWAAYIPSDDDGGDPSPDIPLAVTQTLTLTANTEIHLVSTATRYSQIRVVNDGDDPVFVCADGSPAEVGAAHCVVVEPGSAAGIGNLLPLGNADVPGTDYSLSDGWTSQQYVMPDQGYRTYVSLISGGESVPVSVTVC